MRQRAVGRRAHRRQAVWLRCALGHPGARGHRVPAYEPYDDGLLDVTQAPVEPTAPSEPTEETTEPTEESAEPTQETSEAQPESVIRAPEAQSETETAESEQQSAPEPQSETLD